MGAYWQTKLDGCASTDVRYAPIATKFLGVVK